jgi:uncharacterized protein (TIRG00374 family)
MPDWLKKIVNPKVLIPVVVIAGAVALLFTFGDPKKIIGTMEGFNRVDLIWVFLLSVVYEAVRFVQWWYLLKHEGVKVPLKAQIFSFAGGEATRFFPVGNYFQNYLLTTAEGTDFAFSSAVTTLIIVFEVAVCLTGLIVLGLGDWWWVRPVIVVGLLLTAGVVWSIYKLRGTLAMPGWVERHARVKQMLEKAAGELRQFVAGAKRVLRWRTVATSFALAAAYLITAAGILYVVLEGLGWNETPFGAVLAVYCFSLAFGLIVPLPVDIGVTELSGVGAFLVTGVERNTAISAMLVNRVLTLGFSIVIAAIVMAVLRDELHKALEGRGARKTGQMGFDQERHEQQGREGEHERRAQDDDCADGAGPQRPRDEEGAAGREEEPSGAATK